ncbi:hypothetical protein ABBQ38_014479 [Trebouxia sp. C0009 RCD-2024]
MATPSAVLLLIAVVIGTAAAQIQSPYPVLNITKGAPLPVLAELKPDASGWVTLNMQPATIVGPGDNTTEGDPYIVYTGRTYNQELIAGMIRHVQGDTLRLRVCNNLTAHMETTTGKFDPDYAKHTQPMTSGGISVFKDINILANHLHGFYGSMGTDSPPCDPMPEGGPCYRGDNIFADIEPGQCAYYQYDFPRIASPGALWLHPHHHGSSSVQTHTATVPVLLDVNPSGGLDPLSSDSCMAANMKRFFPADNSNEIILHMQSFMFAVYTEASQNIQNATGPIDDGYITNVVGALPGDALCCSGPEKLDDGSGGTTWENSGDTGPDAGDSFSKLPFYTSGVNADFVTVNGAYQPVINMEAGKVYRWMIIEAAIMKWVHLGFDKPGCVMGIVSRDANYLHTIPRLAESLVLVAANRIELLIKCDAGTYQLQSGTNKTFTQDPGCGSSHCDVYQQPIVATIEVAETPGALPTPADPFGSCTPALPPYLQDLRDPFLTAAHRNEIVPSTGNTGLMNFTNPQEPGPPSSACALNGMTYQDMNAMQEIIGELHELSLWNINVHPYHHHTQPFQIISLPDGVDSDLNNGSWRVGDWADTLELPNIGFQAIVRWIPGPVEITGTGYAVLHCHILPHEDEGCMMKTHLLEKAYMPDPKPTGAHSQGGKAGLTIMVLVLVVGLIGVPVVLYKKKKARKAAENDALMSTQYEAARTQSTGV